MTNAEKFLKDGVDIEEIAREIDIIYQNDVNIANAEQAAIKYFNSTCKPMLTEDERVILRNIRKEYVKVGKNNEGLYFLSYRDCEPNVSYSYYANVFKSSLFSFIQEGEEYSIEELLKGE